MPDPLHADDNKNSVKCQLDIQNNFEAILSSYLFYLVSRSIFVVACFVRSRWMLLLQFDGEITMPSSSCVVGD